MIKCCEKVCEHLNEEYLKIAEQINDVKKEGHLKKHTEKEINEELNALYVYDHAITTIKDKINYNEPHCNCSITKIVFPD